MLKYTPNVPRFLAYLLLFTFSFNLALAKDFSDLASDNPAFESVNHFVDQGCISGYQDGTIKLAKSISRMESVKLILTCLDLPPLFQEQSFDLKKDTIVIINKQEIKLENDQSLSIKIPFNPDQYSNLNFPDIDPNGWYIQYLKEAVIRKIITGYQDNTIRPEQKVSKAELFAILHRITPSQILEKFTIDQTIKANDLDPNQWFFTSAMFALQNELTELNTEQNYNYDHKLNRADFIQALYKYHKWLKKTLNPVQEVIKEVKVIKEVNTPDPEPEAEATPATEPTTEPTPTSNSEPEATSTETTNTENSPVSNLETEQGIASFYSENLRGAKTASGEIFNPDDLTAAHKTLPFGTIVKVENPANGKWVKVKINDRGPYVDGRIIDLSHSAFEAIATLSSGLVNVQLTIEP